LIIEILSGSTEGFDRGDKFFDYQTIKMLQEYLLINTKHKRIDYFQRNPDGNWLLKFYHNDEEYLSLQSINSQISVSTIYEDANLS